jgi:hypothetical protein
MRLVGVLMGFSEQAGQALVTLKMAPLQAAH